MDFVVGFKRLVIACVVAASAGHPLALDVCHSVCEGVRARRLEAAPPCHHVAPAVAQIDHQARPCAQDHAVVPGASGIEAPTQAPAAGSATQILSSFDSSSHGPNGPQSAFSSPSPPPPLASESNAPLRV
jgi:hypothetical protein